MSEPTLYCNACGREIPLRRALGRQFRVCSSECIKEMEWRHACSILGKPYTPSPETEAWAKSVLGEEGGSAESPAPARK
jgi:hypothetical protein